ncbi:MAG: CDP-alcohol phosphatidyltransferase family protein [Sedimentisphaerales bacterium]|nr:CDP-alcohol phosphatidyltransferase family protein [Sedimentisphaerales bacterium]
MRTLSPMNLTRANQITIFRILLILPFILCILHRPESAYPVALRYVAFTIFLFMAASDALDGYLARIRHQATTLGAFLDPLADKLLITAACILLTIPETAVSGFRLPLWLVVLIVGKDLLLLLGFLVVYFVTGRIRIRTVVPGKLATILQLTLVGAILTGPEFSSLLPVWPIFVRLLLWAVAILAVLVMLVYIRGGIRYIEQFAEDGTGSDNHKTRNG